MFKLTVLGNNGPYPAKGGACSGYLLQHEETNIVLDLGSGALANLISVLSSELESIDAIILSHLHSDHTSDISVLRYAVFRANSARDKHGNSCKIPLYCPPEPQLEYDALRSYAQFDVHPITEDLTLNIRGLTLKFAPMLHPYPVFAVSAVAGIAPINAAGADDRRTDAPCTDDGRTNPNGAVDGRTDATGAAHAETVQRKFVYTGDTTWNLELIQFAEGADLMLADANLISQDRLTGMPLLHLTAEECGIAAAEAGAVRLLLTHFSPGADISRRIAEAKAGAQKVLGRSDSLIVEDAQILTSYEI